MQTSPTISFPTANATSIAQGKQIAVLDTPEKVSFVQSLLNQALLANPTSCLVTTTQRILVENSYFFIAGYRAGDFYEWRPSGTLRINLTLFMSVSNGSKISKVL